MTVRIAVWTGILLLWAAAAVLAQGPAVLSLGPVIQAAPVAVVFPHRHASEAPLQPMRGDLVRELDDPHTGLRWLLYRDLSNPGGPGRLVQAIEQRPAGHATSANATLTADAPERPVIHLGDRVILEESTPVVEARLEAVALDPAPSGSRLRVRLRIGGLTVPAVALGPGRVGLAPPAQAQP